MEAADKELTQWLLNAFKWRQIVFKTYYCLLRQALGYYRK